MAKQKRKGVMDSSKYLTGFKETDMNVRTFIMNLHSLLFSFQSTVLTLEWHHWVIFDQSAAPNSTSPKT
jgi:hypothetical protein